MKLARIRLPFNKEQGHKKPALLLCYFLYKICCHEIQKRHLSDIWNLWRKGDPHYS